MNVLAFRMPFACLFVVLIILIYHMRRKNLSSLITRIYNLLLGTSLVHIVFEIITEYTVVNRDTVPSALNEFFHIVFELTVLWAAFLLNIHIVSSVAIRKNKRSNAELIVSSVATLIFSICIIVAPQEYIDTEFGSYARGMKAYFLYAGVIVSIACLTRCLLKNKKYVDEAQYFGLKLSGIIAIVLTSIQIIFPYILVTGLVMTSVVLNLYLGLENPDAYYNNRMNMFNEYALRRVLLERIMTGRRQEALAVAIKPKSKSDREYVKKQAEYLKKVMGRRYNMDIYVLTDKLFILLGANGFKRFEDLNSIDLNEFNNFREHVDIYSEIISCEPDKASYDTTMDDLEDMKMRFNNEENYIDAMTGVYNRNRYEEDLQTIKENESGCCVVFVDINGLKYVNDNFGHDAGDTLIIETTKILVRAFSGVGQIYRVGGDEFMVIYFGALPIDSIISSAKASAEERSGELDIPISFAAGYAYSDSGSGLDKAIKTADTNMYEDKHKSKYHR